MRISWSTSILLLAVLVVGGWLRFTGLGEPGFWCDEEAYLYLDTAPPGAHHAHSHGFDLYVRGYAQLAHVFGGSIKNEFTFRLLPATLGTLAVLIMALAGAACGARGMGICAAVLVALHPFAISSSRTATQYGSLLFATTLMLAAAVCVLRHGRWWAWSLLVLASALAFHLQIFASCYIIGLWAAVALCGLIGARWRGRSVARVAATVAAAALGLGLLCLPEVIGYTLPMLRGSSVGNLQMSQQTLWQAINFSALQDTLVSPHAWQRYAMYLLMALGAAWSARSAPVVLLSAVMTTAVTVLLLHSMRLQQVIGFPPRYACFLLPLGLLLAGMGVWVCIAGVAKMAAWCGGLPGRLLTLLLWSGVTAGGVLFCVAQVGETLYQWAYYPLSEWREIGAFLNTVVQPGDAVLGGYDTMLLERFYTNTAARIERVTGWYDARDVTPALIESYMRHHTRVWCCFTSGFVRWSGSSLPGWLDATCIGLPFWSYGAAVHYWSRPDAERWGDQVQRQRSERMLVERMLDVAPRSYRSARRLVELQWADGAQTAALRRLQAMLRQNPMDPYVHYELSCCYRDGVGGHTNLVAARRHLALVNWCYRMLPGTVEDLRGYALVAALDLAARMGAHACLRRLLHRAPRLIPVLPPAGQAVVQAALQRYQAPVAAPVAAAGAPRVPAMTQDDRSVWSTNLVSADLRTWLWWSPGVEPTGVVTFVNAPIDSTTQTVACIANTSVLYFGLQQRVPVVSGAVYRLSGMARYAGPAGARFFGGRLACYVAGQPEHQLVWPETDGAWMRKSCVISNSVTGTAVVFAHLGFGGVVTTGEFAGLSLHMPAPLQDE